MQNPIAAYPGSDVLGPLTQWTVTTKTNAGANTITAAQFINGVWLRDPNGASRTDTTPTAVAVLNRIGPAATVGQTFFFTVRNDADGAERITIAGGTGVTVSGRAVVDPGETARFVAVITNVTYASAAITLYRTLTSEVVPTIIAITADGAVAPSIHATYNVTKAGVAAMTLAAPTAVTHDGQIIRIFSTTANAHTLTATGLLQTGSANVNVATFAAFAGAGLTLMANNAKWVVLQQVGITFS